MSPDLAVRLLALAKASALAGSAVAGAYLGAAVLYASEWQIPFRRTATWWSVATAVVAVAVVGTALWLERECRTPPSEDGGLVT